MFKSIQYKIVTIFLLLIITVVIVIGVSMTSNIIRFYNNEFTVMMEQVFSDQFINQLSKIAEQEDGLKNLNRTITSYIGQLGIDTYRFYCIIDVNNAAVLASSDAQRSQGLDMSDNIITAMTGARGNSVNIEKPYMDYAVSIGSEKPLYIVYVRDTKEELTGILNNILGVMVRTLLIALAIVILLGYLLGRTITSPIITLTKRAERIAAGDFESIPPSNANDEIGRLANTFRYMSATLSATIDEVNSEKNKIETILQNMTDGVLAFNLDGALIHINPEAQKLTGITYTDGVSFDSLFKELGIDINMGELIYSKDAVPDEKTASLASKFIKFNFATINKDDKPNGILVVMHDITKQEKLELGRREFVSDVSHELRTPLTTIVSYTETLMDTDFEDKSVQNRFLQTIMYEANRMTHIIKELLTLARLDARKPETTPPDLIDIKEFLEGIVERMSLTAKDKQQTITYTPMNPVGELYASRNKLEQVIVNILSNAVKYTPVGGKIEVFSGKIYSDVYIKVVDNGIGIPKEDQPRIFERFYRVDKARSRDTGGTGLGLAIAKQIIDEMDGDISINSELDKGTEVTITIPT